MPSSNEKVEMKNGIAIFVLILLVDACTVPTPLPGGTSVPQQAIPTVIGALGPDLYESKEFGFNLQIPAGYRREELPRREGILLAIGFAPSSQDQIQEVGFPIGLTVYEKPSQVPLLDWFSTHTGDLTDSGQPASEEALFYTPLIQNQDDFKGKPALQYLSGSRPVPYETLVDLGAWVIGPHYLQDYPEDYRPVYNQMLASLEFFDPDRAQTSASLPTATPVVCLDENAKPRTLPKRQTPLEVQFIGDGNLWVWEEGGSAQQISATGDARSFYFSPDGKVIALTRGPQYGQTELWGIHRDGTNLRQLVSADQIQELAGEPSTTQHPYTDGIVSVEWIDGTHRLGFEISRAYDAIGGCCESRGHWQVDVDTGELSAWTPPPETVDEPEGLLSPDGSQVAILKDGTLSLVNADGSNLREDVFSFTTVPVMEGPGTVHPYIVWAIDSGSLLAITFSGDVYADDTHITTWRIPLNGSPAQELYTFSTFYFWVNLSPNQEYLAHMKRVWPRTNDHELHLATFDGSKDIVYAAQHGLEFLHWHPDSYHFVYQQWNIFRPFLGSVCGGSVPLLDGADVPALQIEWVDATRFLYAAGSLDPLAGPRELRLGQLGAPSIRIGPFNGESAQYVFNVEEAPLGRE